MTDQPPPEPKAARNDPFMLMMVVTIGLFCLVGLLCFHDLPEKSSSVVFTVVGSITTGWLMGVGYFWGSSVASKAKDAVIAAMTTKAAP